MSETDRKAQLLEAYNLARRAFLVAVDEAERLRAECLKQSGAYIDYVLGEPASASFDTSDAAPDAETPAEAFSASCVYRDDLNGPKGE